jgi:DNA invertase Pin-like site-specific DNA recombinase
MTHSKYYTGFLIKFKIKAIMKAIYIRVSTVEQNEERQTVKGIKTFIDKISGSIAFSKRPKAKKLLVEVEKGFINEVQVHSIDRLGRNTLDILQTIEYLTIKKVNVISNKEGLQTLIDGKVNPVAKMMIGILGTLAEFELSRIKERQAEGILNAKKKGVYIGRTIGTTESDEVFLNKAKSQIISKHLKNGESLRRTALLSKSSVNTVKKVKELIKTYNYEN